LRDFELEVYFSEWELSAKYHMTASDIESMTIAELLAMDPGESVETFGQQWLGYTETWGSLAL